MKTIAALLTVHNRREKTLECLRCLYKQLPIEGYVLDTYLTEDGCTEGMSEAVREELPQVTIINGDGSLFWNRGMYAAWCKASETKEYDYYLWLNDDTILYDNSLKRMLELSQLKDNKCIIVGATCDENGIITYGGRNRQGELIPKSNFEKKCYYFNGNIILVPKNVYMILGTNSYIYHHALGDFDYGLRAAEKGISCYVLSGFMGICDNNKDIPIWCSPNISFKKRWNKLRSPLGCNPEEFFIFSKKHYGYLNAINSYIKIHLRVIFPSLWVNNNIFSPNSKIRLIIRKLYILSLC